MDIKAIDRQISHEMEASLVELERMVAQPSVSATGEGVLECASLVAELLKKRGFTVQSWDQGGAPVITAERKGRSEKTLIFYDHYDVQPAEPLELWVSPPFKPERRDGRMYGRGVNDNKGNITNRLLALDAILAAEGELPCTVKFVLEGEEETTSAAFTEFVRQYPERIQADACIWEFGGVDEEDRPQQYLGLRGICYVELTVECTNQDVHSGLGGSIFPNAAWRLVWALNSLKTRDERVLISGFYDRVIPLSDSTMQYIEDLPDLAQIYKTRYGLQEFLNGMTGGTELKVAEAYVPTCTICGLTSGYQGPGSKTVLPARASAKVDFRLVPEQDPFDIFALLRKHLDDNGFSDVKTELLADCRPAVTEPDDPFVQMVVDTAEAIYGQKMQIVPSVGGSGPNAIFRDVVPVPIVSVGVGHPDMQAHAPNENMRLDLYEKSAHHLVRIIDRFANM